MRVLYIGDIVGEFGRWVIERELPVLKRDYRPDLILAQAENVTHGSGLSIEHYQQLRALGIDGFMGGNHTLARKETNALLNDRNHPVTRPANYPEGTPGLRYKLLSTPQGAVALISLLGQLVGKDQDAELDNPLQVIDELLSESEIAATTVKIVNFHGDYSSEKVVIGHFLDGRVSAVIGDHWHVPTSDGRVLPAGTAHISDVGMSGALNSCLGVKTDVIIARWYDQQPSRNRLEDSGAYQLNGVCIDIDTNTGKASDITPVFRSGNR